jgi:serine protease Do
MHFSLAGLRPSICLVLGLTFAQDCLAEAYKAPDHDLAFRLKASVAKVHVVTKNGGHGVGTGVVVAKDLVATNCHVLANTTGANITKFGDSFQPVSVKADWKHDLCILRFKFLDLKPVELGDSESIAYEQNIFSIGFPGGPPKPIITNGKIKAIYPIDDSAIVRTDASFIMGASGSPVFNSEGKLIALSTFKSPGHAAYFYNLPVKWIKALLEKPESEEVATFKTDESPFWDAPEESRPFFMRVVLPYQNEKWPELEKIATDWVAKEPKSEEAHFYLGVAQEKLGKLPEAKAQFAEVLKLHPQHSGTLLELGLIAKQEGNQTELDRLKVAMAEVDNDVLEAFNLLINPQPDPEAK